MRSGEMRHQIEIQRQREVVDADNVSGVEYVSMKKAWAKVNGLFGKEFWEAKQYEAENTVEFRIRFLSCPDLSPTDRIVFRGKIYNITAVDNILYRNETWKIKATAAE